MLCPKCNSKSIVGVNRPDTDRNEVYRAHKCKECGHKFHTVEFVVEETESFKKLWKSLMR